MIKRLIAPFLIIALCLPLAACKKTTLDRVGAVLVQGATLYVLELDQIKPQLDPAKWERLHRQALAIQSRATLVASTIAQFPEGKVTRENSAQVVALVGILIEQVNGVLTDPAIAGLGEDSKIVKVLRYVTGTAGAISITLAGLFPPPIPNAPEATQAIRARDIEIKLPKQPKF